MESIQHAKRPSAAPVAIAALIVGVLVLLILWKPRLGQIDDHMLLAALAKGEWLSMMRDAQQGRFLPLDVLELNLVSLITTAPFAFYAVNALQLVVLAATFFDLARRIAGSWAALLSLTFLLLTPGFMEAWLRLFVGERGALFFFVMFLWLYFRFADTNKSAYFAGALVAGNAALYYKEPGFIMLGVFAACRLLGVWLSGPRSAQDKGTRRLDALLVASASIYVLAYLLLVYPYRGTSLYGQMSFDPFLQAGKVLVSYATGDPVLFFLAGPLFIWRAIAVLRDPKAFEPFADPLLAGAIASMATFVAMNMFASRYWLPAYAFFLPALLIYWQRLHARWFWIGAGSVAMLFVVTTSLPHTLRLASFSKYVPRNYEAAVAFLASDIMSRNADRVVAVFVDRGELAVSLARFLEAARVPPNRFVVRPADTKAQSAHTGDYFVLTPFTRENPDATYREALDHDYRLVWRSHSPYAVPNLNLRVLLKAIALEYLFPAGGAEIGASKNFEYSVDYEVFVRR